MNKNLIIILLAILAAGGIGYTIYDIVSENNDKENIEDSNNDTNKNEEVTYKEEQFKEIIDKELFVLLKSTDLNGVTNQDKLRMLFLIYKDKNGWAENGLSKIDLENIKENSSLKNLNVEYTDIYDFYRGGLTSTNEVAYKYDKNTGKYSYTGALGHGDVAILKYDNLLSFENVDNKYIISYKYVFKMARGDGPSSFDLYYTIEDALNRENAFRAYEITQSDSEVYKLSNQADLYVKENYETFKDKLDTYTYVFEIQEGNIVLTDFYRK